MNILGTIMIILGVILALISGVIALASSTAVKNDKNWQSFVDFLEKDGGPQMPEEELLSMVLRIRTVFICIFAVSILIVVAGILIIKC